MIKGKVVALFICPAAGEAMEEAREVYARTGAGLDGDRYRTGHGSWNKGKPGKRQVTLMNATFFPGSGFEFSDARRNIFTEGIELMRLIGEEFMIGGVRMRGVKYCFPCERPSKLSGKPGFAAAFHDRGGLIAEILDSGKICVGDEITADD